MDCTLQAKRNGSSGIHLHISSSGGNIATGFAAYYHLRSLGIPLVAHNIGDVASVAMLPFLAADTRLAGLHTCFLFHGVCGTRAVNTIDIRDTREVLRHYEHYASRYAALFDARTQRKFNIRDYIIDGNTSRMPAQVGFEKGITTEQGTSDPVIPEGAVLWSITPNTI